MGWWDDISGFLGNAWDEYAPNVSSVVSTAVSSPNETVQSGNGNTKKDTGDSKGSSLWGDILQTGVEGAIGLGTSIFGINAAKDIKNEDRAYAEAQAEKERQRELDLLALKAKYGLLGGNAAGAAANNNLAAGYAKVIDQNQSASNAKVASLKDLAVLAQNAALRSGR